MVLKKVIIIFMLFIIFFYNICIATENSEQHLTVVLNDFSNNGQINEEQNRGIQIYSESAILMEQKTGKILYEKDIYARKYPASTTKILTGIIALEKCNLDEKAMASDKAVNTIKSGYSTANIQVGEVFTIGELLDVMLIHSANEAANIIAEHISGSIEEFSNVMNAKAKELGCLNSNFVNPNGMHDENHYSTAYDMALIAREVMKYEELREIVGKIYYELGDTNKYTGKPRIYETTNGLLLSGNPITYYKYAIGVKTGYTTPAGSCLAACAVKGDMELYVVVLKCEGTAQRYSSIKNLYDYGFDAYSYKDIAKRGDNIQTVDVKEATSKTRKLNAVLAKDINVLVKDEAEYIIEPQVTLEGEIKAPIQRGTKIGTVSYTIEDVYYESDLLAGSDVEKTYIPIFFLILFILLVIVFGINRLISNYRKKKRMKKIRNIKK